MSVLELPLYLQSPCDVGLWLKGLKVTCKLQATNSKTHYARQVVKILTQVFVKTTLYYTLLVSLFIYLYYIHINMYTGTPSGVLASRGGSL